MKYLALFLAYLILAVIVSPNLNMMTLVTGFVFSLPAVIVVRLAEGWRNG